MKITIGTTPTITYKFSKVSPSEMRTAILTIKRATGILLEKTLSDAAVSDDSLSWTLSQEETLSLGTSPATMMVNWVTAAGMRGASEEVTICGRPNHIREVI